jgi:DNA-binding transcriptional LysR family regulator
MMKYLRHMMVFSKVVESGSISSAADQLSLSKSVVSQHLQTLERELNVELLKRTTRRQVLTPAGKQFYQQCQQIDLLSQRAWSDARDSQQLPIGSVSISAPHALMDTIVAPAIGALVNEFPQISPYLHTDDTRVHLIQDNIDIAIRIGHSKDSEFKQKRIGQFGDQLCISRRYLEKYLKNKAGAPFNHPLSTQSYLDEIRENPSLMSQFDYIANSWQGSRVTHQLINQEPISQEQSCNVQFQPTRRANSINGVLALALEGAGLALIPELILSQLNDAQRSEFVVLTTKYTLSRVPVFALHAFSQTTPYIVQLCIDAIQKRMQKISVD